LNYSVLEKEENTEVKVSGKICKAAVLSSGSFIRSLIEKGAANITLDIDGLEDEREMIYHVALINSFKKASDYAGGDFVLVSNRSSVRKYLSRTGLERLFPVDINDTIREI
jgi:anti-anti-sigma regulatory factor